MGCAKTGRRHAAGANRNRTIPFVPWDYDTPFPEKRQGVPKKLKTACKESPGNPIYPLRGGGEMEELYQQYVQIVYRFLVSACRDPRLAEDLTQETFPRAWEY